MRPTPQASRRTATVAAIAVVVGATFTASANWRVREPRPCGRRRVQRPGSDKSGDGASPSLR